MVSKKKYYAVAAGYRPGVYDNWPAAQSQVKGFAGAVYKGFPTRAEAEAWIQKPSYSPGAGRNNRSSSSGKPVTVTDVEPRPGGVTIYTDGGARNNPGPGGYGVVQIFNGEQTELSGGFRLTTNNRMELMGCIVALRELKHKDSPITLYSDSSYVVNGISKGWARGWRRRGWIKSNNEPAVNSDLWAELLDLVEGLDISFNWVRGHSGNPYNERCDQLAVAMSGRDGLPVDTGYKG